ncbi:MAG: hypothetical protein ACK4SY_02555 [Pyrobaculum sp.]
MAKGEFGVINALAPRGSLPAACIAGGQQLRSHGPYGCPPAPLSCYPRVFKRFLTPRFLPPGTSLPRCGRCPTRRLT